MSSFNVTAATTKELVNEYNRITGKSITKFSSRAAGEKQYAAAVAALAKDEDEEKPAAKPKSALAKTAAMMDKVSQPKPAKAARVAKPKAVKAPADRSAAIRKSWSVLATHNSRSARHNVQVHEEGRKAETLKDYRSTLAAFEALGLPIGTHIRFRMELKRDGKKTFEHDGVKYQFAIVEKAAE